IRDFHVTGVQTCALPIFEAHLGPDARSVSDELIEQFLARRADGALATDQLLNAVYLATSGSRPPETKLQEILETVLRPIERPGRSEERRVGKEGRYSWWA